MGIQCGLEWNAGENVNKYGMQTGIQCGLEWNADGNVDEIYMAMQ